MGRCIPKLHKTSKYHAKEGYSYYHECNLQWTYLTIIQSDKQSHKYQKYTKRLNINRLTRFQFMGKFMHSELPLSRLELFQSQVVNHEHDTRHRDGPNLPLSHSEIMRRSIFHRGPNLWMNLPNHLRTTATTNALVNNWRKDKISQY